MCNTIFMIHGMWSGPWCWKNYREYFQDLGYRCLTPTLRYHDMDPGEEPDPRLGTTSLLDYTSDLEANIRELPDTPILMGHSMGGLLAQILACRGLARSMVLLAPAPARGNTALLKPTVIRSFRSVQTKWGFWKRPMRQSFNEAVYSSLHLLPMNEQREIYGKFVYDSGRAAFEMGYWFLDARKAAGVDPSKVSCPVLAVSGSEDRIVPTGLVRKTARRYGRFSTFMEFSGHAHWLLAEPGWLEIAECTSVWMSEAKQEL